MPVSELQSRMSSREFTEWMCYYQIEPFGAERDDYRSGIVAATIANVNRGEGQRAFEPGEFMPRFGPQAEEPTGQTPDTMLDMIRQLNAAFGGVEL